MSKHRPASEFRPLNRLEISVAEVLRQNVPFSPTSDEIWLDIMEDFSKMFKSGDSRFDTDAFMERCWGEEYHKSPAQEEAKSLAELMDQAAALDSLQQGGQTFD